MVCMSWGNGAREYFDVKKRIETELCNVLFNLLCREVRQLNEGEERRGE